jgi:hypothetical protein
MAQSKEFKFTLRNLAEEFGVVAMKLRVVSIDLGEQPADRLYIDGLEYILGDQVETLETLAEKLWELGEGKNKLFDRKAA